MPLAWADVSELFTCQILGQNGLDLKGPGRRGWQRQTGELFALSVPYLTCLASTAFLGIPCCFWILECDPKKRGVEEL